MYLAIPYIKNHVYETVWILTAFCNQQDDNNNICGKHHCPILFHNRNIHVYWPKNLPLSHYGISFNAQIFELIYSLSQMRPVIVTFQPIILFNNSMTLIPIYEWFQWSIFNGCGIPAGKAFPSGYLIPPLFGISYAPISPKMPCFSQPFTFYISRYSLSGVARRWKVEGHSFSPQKWKAKKKKKKKNRRFSTRQNVYTRKYIFVY